MGSDAGTKLDSAGELVEGLVVASPGQFDDLEHHRVIVEHHREMANCLQPDIASPSDFFLSYAAVQVLAQGIDAAGDCDGTDKIAQAIRSGTFDTMAGSMSFLPNGDLVSPEFVVEECHYGEEGRITWTKA
jgi:branched-chain amino acid transport system substrate-binding protein